MKNVMDVVSIRELEAMERASLKRHHEYAARIKARIIEIRKERGTVLKTRKMSDHEARLMSMASDPGKCGPMLNPHGE